MLGRVTIVGCGLIGGSLVKRLRERKAAARIGGIDRDEVLAAARPFLDAVAAPASQDARDLVGQSDLVVLATPVDVIARDLAWVLDAIGTDAAVTDTGSVKRPMMEVALRHQRGSRYVGGHPMTGREIGGFAAATSDLFEGARWFIVEAAAAARQAAALERVSRVIELVDAAGAAVAFIDAESHDRAMAYVSHAPQLIASALAAVAARTGVTDEAGPGFRDMTRIAGGPAAMWREVFAANRENIAAALDDVLEPLLRVRDALGKGGERNLAAVLDLLEEARTTRGAGPAAPSSPESRS